MRSDHRRTFFRAWMVLPRGGSEGGLGLTLLSFVTLVEPLDEGLFEAFVLRPLLLGCCEVLGVGRAEGLKCEGLENAEGEEDNDEVVPATLRDDELDGGNGFPVFLLLVDVREAGVGTVDEGWETVGLFILDRDAFGIFDSVSE